MTDDERFSLLVSDGPFDEGEPAQPRPEQLVRGVLDLPRDVGVGRAAVRRVVLEAAAFGRVVRRRDHDPVCLRAAARVVR